jgi:hypothetical protein
LVLGGENNMTFAGKLLLTSFIFIIIGFGIANFGDETDTDGGIMVGMIIIIISFIGIITSLLMMIWM